MTFVLRHNPEAIGMKRNPDGWLNIHELIENANAHGKSITHSQLHEIVASNDEKRFALSTIDSESAPCRTILSEATPIDAAVREMEECQIRRLLVSGSDNEIVGIVSLGDIVAKSGEHQLSAELIEMVSVPAEPAG